MNAMPSVSQCEVMSVDLPFRKAFRHAAATRSSSDSLFVKCSTDTGSVGFGESLPREYVTGETRDAAFELLKTIILPRLVGMKFHCMEEVFRFLGDCDGKAPPGWLDPARPQLAAWCAAELALLDTFGHAFQTPVWNGERTDKIALRYSGVLSAHSREWKSWWSLLKLRLYGITKVKVKIAKENLLSSARRARRVLGRKASLRVDANMSWSVAEALKAIRELSQFGIHCIEQPLRGTNLEGQARLVRETEAEIIVDEGFTDRASLERLVQRQACSGISVRISKCGGLVAARRRCDEAQRAGLVLQIGCQVGESSLLSAAQRILIAAVREPKYLEGCYGKHLLREDPVSPNLQLGYGGRLPGLPVGPGLGVTVDEDKLNRWVSKRALVSREHQTTKQEWKSYVPAR